MKRVNSIIEIQMNSHLKYEMNLDSGMLFLDRVIKLPYPANYGYIPGTVEDDEDAIDIFVIANEPITQGAMCQVYLAGAFICKDQDVYDRKLVAYLESQNNILYSDYLKIKEFLTNYKIGFEVIEYVTQDEAIKIYENSAKVFSESIREVK